MSTVNLRGVGVALITPFNNYDIDYEALARMVEHTINGGVDFIVALGSTAETPTLSIKERQEVLRFIVNRANGRVPIVAGMGSNDTRALTEHLRTFDMSGVSAILSVVPYYNKPSQEGIYRHFMAVAEASPVPVIIYNVPGRTGVNMTAETTLRLAHSSDNIIAVKEASGDIEQMQRILDGRPEGFLVLSGDDGITVELVKRGGDGVISVAANAFPTLFCKCVHDAIEGRIGDAESEIERLGEAIGLLFKEGNPTGIKAMTAAMGLTSKLPRLPLVAASDALSEMIKSAVERYELR